MDYAHEMNRTRLESLWKPWKITGALAFVVPAFLLPLSIMTLKVPRKMFEPPLATES